MSHKEPPPKGGEATSQRSRFLQRLTPPTPRPKRPTSQRGADAEKIAAHYLEEQGLSILATHQRTRWGEIDIIAQDGDTIVFIEIRMRKANDPWEAIASVDPRKQQRITQTALAYLVAHPHLAQKPHRFDIFGIAQTPDQSLHFHHLRAAFGA
ncbi:MAG: YraN family protein [Myxococcales bacterium]|nr:YraN family protein [Myxococcales bacterium]